MKSAKQNFRVQQWITGLSVVLFIIKIAGYYITHSLSILSDALESIVNVLAGFIGLYSLYVAAKPRDIDHPYGHGKAEFVSAAAEGGLIMSSGILILYETITNFIERKQIESLDTGLWLVAATAVTNYIAGFICLKIGKRNNSLALQASGKHLQVDTYSTLGIIAGLVIILFTQLYWLDKVIALAMSVIVMYNGYKIIRASLAGIMDEADMQLLNKMVMLLNANRRDNWIDLHNLRVIKYGSLLHVDCHLTVPWNLNVLQAHEEVKALETLVKEEFGDALEMFVHVDAGNETIVKDRPHWTLEKILTNKRHSEQ
ncbi:cation diffusion facilitator family transporter [Foetidibacter luteolus]|uniref:cation diffusion facilitator family transporter n=1 Tax=Foetidibacter luteolus TaxID=2608880 RepID=UPI00129BA08C|nr:cation diffusion facilitator family transporter [Foetidibacter luteolus]